MASRADDTGPLLYCPGRRCRVRDFPRTKWALDTPNGLLALGGDLGRERLLAAYRRGIFPWYEAGSPILWWAPDPRCILFPEGLRVSRRLRRTLRGGRYAVRFNTRFDEVIRGCAGPRRDRGGTWITEEMIRAYCALHRQGCAHSVEAWRDETLAGGLYGIALGRVFFGESMFSRLPDASKVCLHALAERLRAGGGGLIDCQLHSPHLDRLGAVCVPRRKWEALLARELRRLPPLRFAL